MPVYDAYCENCDWKGEVIKRMNDPMPECEHCHTQLTRIYTPPALHLPPDKQFNPKYDKWLNSPETKAKIASGEYKVANKSDDCFQD